MPAQRDGLEYTDPNADEEVRKFIHAARIALMDDPEVVKHAIESTDSLENSAAPVIYMVITNVEKQVGPVEDEEDLKTIIMHLAGTIVEIAAEAGDPDAQDQQGAVIDITGRTMELFADEEDQEAPAMEAQEQGMPMEQPSGPVNDGITAATEKLGAAIAIHEGHMSGKVPTTGMDGENSQQEMMDLMKQALSLLQGMSPEQAPQPTLGPQALMAQR